MRKTALVISVLILICSSMGQNVNKNTNNINHTNKYIRSDVNGVLKEFRKKYIIVHEKIAEEEIIKTKPKEQSYSEIYTITAYDLSIASCGKSRGSVGFGITSSGFNLTGHTLSSARVISVDPSKIPIGSLVKIEFLDGKYLKYNSTYKALDKGGTIKGKKIDIFIGDTPDSNSVAKNFGVTKAKVTILYN